jgi:membrane fusion protein (multidrug efflux system)
MLRGLPLVLLVLVACSGGGDKDRYDKGYGEKGGWGKRDKSEPITLVLVDRVRRGEVADNLASTAIIESESSADIIPSTTGVVLSIHKGEGDVVQRGDLLAVLESVSLDAGAERSRAELTRVQQQYDEMAQLAARGAVSDRELEDLAYTLQTAKTTAREASRSFGQTRLTAPFDGVVAARDVRVGELVGSGTAAFKVVDLEHLRAVTTMPERDLKRVAIGQSATLTSAYDDESFAKGQVTRVAPVIDAASGTFRVTIQLEGVDPMLRPGQFVTVDLEVARRRDVLVVPKRALVYEDGIPVVYRYIPQPEGAEDEDEKSEWGDDDGEGWYARIAAMFADEDEDEDEDEDDDPDRHVAERVAVKLGLVDDHFAEVLQGVEEGDQLIVVGQSHLRDGARVRVNDQRDNAGAEPPEERKEDKG